jgi:outer membrane protein
MFKTNASGQMNKTLSYVLVAFNAVLLIAIIILYVIFFKQSSNNTNIPTLKFEGDSVATLPLAYVNIDSVLAKYNYAVDVSDELMRKAESSRASLNSKHKNLINEQQEFQRKYQNNGFLTPERAQMEAERIQKLEQELERTAGRLDQELMVEQHKVNQQITDSIRNCIQLYNLEAGYQIIFSNVSMGNILYAKDNYDITEAVLVLLNSRYHSEKKK